MKSRILKLFLPFLIVSPALLSSQEHGTESTEFWLTYLENLTLLFNGDPQFSLYIDAETAGNIQIEFPATGLNYEYEYEADKVTEIILPAALYYSENSEVVTNKGLKITTTSPVELTAFHYRVFFSEATKVLAIENLGSEYFATCFLDYDLNIDSPSSFVIVATEDNTEVLITPSANTADFRPKDIPFAITLDAGQTFEVQSPGDLTGSHIIAQNGENLALFNGALKGNVACGPADSHMYDQQLPVGLHGREYAAIPFANQSQGYFRILSLKDENLISISGDFLQKLDKGEYLDIELSEASIIKGTEDCAVSQFSYSYECSSPKIGDPNMLQLYPINYKNTRCTSTNSIGFGENIGGFSDRYITLIASPESEQTVEVDNVILQWNSISSSDYRYSVVEVQEETSKVTAPLGVQAYAYGFGDYDAYTYSLGYDRALTSDIKENLVQEVKIYPNPSRDFLHINSENLITNVSIRNQFGQELEHVSNVNTTSVKLDISELATGMLYIQLSTSTGLVTKSIIKI